MTFKILKNKNIKIWIFLETCKTVGSSGSPCVFPFVYRDQTYDTCTTRDSDTGQPWCATKVDSDGWVVDHAWGDCDQEQCITKDSLHVNWTRLELYKNTFAAKYTTFLFYILKAMNCVKKSLL